MEFPLQRAFSPRFAGENSKLKFELQTQGKLKFELQTRDRLFPIFEIASKTFFDYFQSLPDGQGVKFDKQGALPDKQGALSGEQGVKFVEKCSLIIEQGTFFNDQGTFSMKKCLRIFSKSVKYGTKK